MFFNCSIFDGNQCSNLDGSGQERDLKLLEIFFENIVQLPNFGNFAKTNGKENEKYISSTRFVF